MGIVMTVGKMPAPKYCPNCGLGASEEVRIETEVGVRQGPRMFYSGHWWLCRSCGHHLWDYDYWAEHRHDYVAGFEEVLATLGIITAWVLAHKEGDSDDTVDRIISAIDELHYDLWERFSGEAEGS